MKALAVCTLAAALVLSGWTFLSRVPATAAAEASLLDVPRPRAVDSRYVDMAVACLTLGTSDPPLDEMNPLWLDTIAEQVARVLEMHMEGSFDSYLQAHRSDLAWAQEERAEDVADLRSILSADFGVAGSEVPDQWIEGLRMFWTLLYPEPVMLEVDPLSARLEYRTTRAEMVDDGPGLEEYESTFEERRAASPRRINNAMALPHRRTPEELALALGELTWFDFQVDVVLGRVHRYHCNLLLRFVWDGVDGEWFLSRAVTSYPDHFDLLSSRCLLLF